MKNRNPDLKCGAVLETDYANHDSAAAEVSTLANYHRKWDRFDRAKQAILAGEQGLREGYKEAADYLAMAEAEDRTTQREMASGVGKSVGWVNRLLKWREGGYRGETPFAEPSRVARERKKLVQSTEQKFHKAQQPNAGLSATNDEVTGTANVGAVSTESASVNKAKNANASPTPTKSKPTIAKAGLTTGTDTTTSKSALTELKSAADRLLPKMNFDDRRDFTSYLLKQSRTRVA